MYDKKHAYKHAYKCMKKTRTLKYTHILDSQFQHPGGMGYLAQGHLSCGKELNCQPSSCQPTIPLFKAVSGD